MDMLCYTLDCARPKLNDFTVSRAVRGEVPLSKPLGEYEFYSETDVSWAVPSLIFSFHSSRNIIFVSLTCERQTREGNEG